MRKIINYIKLIEIFSIRLNKSKILLNIFIVLMIVLLSKILLNGLTLNVNNSLEWWISISNILEDKTKSLKRLDRNIEKVPFEISWKIENN